MADHYPVLVEVAAYYEDLDFWTDELQLRCGCTTALEHDFGHAS
ncbi:MULTISPECIES: hypothetical protein [unclassified Microbacterium]